MDQIDQLIAAFESENTPSLSDPDSESVKDRVISELEAHSSDPRVLSFYLKVATNRDEYDLARIEVFKVLHVRPTESEGERSRIGVAIVGVLRNDGDEDVRNYAAIAASSYMTVSVVQEVIESILLDSSIGPNLRANAFAAFESAGPTTSNIRVMQAMTKDATFQKSADRVLQKWRAVK